jgi:TonB family protein
MTQQVIIKRMKNIITFLFLSILFQSFSFCQTTKELESTKDSLKLEEPEEEKIFKVVEDIRRFPGCEGQGLSQEEIQECSKNEMLKFIYSNIKYPKKARENGTVGRVDVQFQLLQDGSVGHIKMLRDIGDGCGEEAARVIELMNHMEQKWTPSKSRGKTVKLKFKIQFLFLLLSEDDKYTKGDKLDNSYALEYPIVVSVSPLKPEEEKIFKVVENMPRFPGCEGKRFSKQELKNCSDAEMLKFVYSNLKYPKKAIEEKTEGRVIMKFVVKKDGSVGNVKIIRDIGNGCGEEAKRVVLLMNDMPQRWIQVMRRPVNVAFTLPVSFRLPSPSPKTKIEEPEEEKIFKVVEDLPRFPGCEGRGKSKKELKECSEHKMQEFISSHLKYPAKARENMTQGIIMIEFVVRRGKVEDIKILNDIGNGCGQEARRVIELMNELRIRWSNKSRGYASDTKFTIPISFQLNKK